MTKIIRVPKGKIARLPGGITTSAKGGDYEVPDDFACKGFKVIAKETAPKK